jgi:hypothetical protein
MNTHQIQCSPILAALRARQADFFKMQVPHTPGKKPPQDAKPLCRSLIRPQSLGVETNENMCFALWQLMARS